MADSLRVVVVDDHELFRAGVIHTLGADAGIEVVAEGDSAATAVELALEFLPDLILLDVSMPGGGISAAKSIQISCPVVKIVMLTVSELDDDVYLALQAGAHGYILKGIGGIRLVEVVKRLCAGETYVSPNLATRLLTDVNQKKMTELYENSQLSELSNREEQILEAVARGLSNREIGDELSIGEKTVKHYMTNVLKKLHVRNRVEAAMIMARNRA